MGAKKKAMPVRANQSEANIPQLEDKRSMKGQATQKPRVQDTTSGSHYHPPDISLIHRHRHSPSTE
jgi:hypothetical protein